MRAELLNRFAAVGRLCDQRHIRLNADEAGDAFADDRMVSHRENANGGLPCHHASPFDGAGGLDGHSRDQRDRAGGVA
jgi:hypothetical protein